MEYYVQEYAKKRADKILPVPKSYPLRGDFGLNFIADFSALTEILKKIYEDVAENPAAYDCELYPLSQEARGAGVDNESNGSLDRIVKCLRILCSSGDIENSTLKVNNGLFIKQIKKVKNHLAIIEKLKDFGFCFRGDIHDKNADCFFVEYPDKPNIINVLKIYMDCWNEVLNDEYLKSEIKKNGFGCIAYYYGYYLFDYKVTANPEELDSIQLLKDNCCTWDENSKNIYISFYKYSKNYPAIRFSDGTYYIGKKRICTFRYNDKTHCLLKMKLKNPAKYITVIEKLPQHLQTYFSKAAKQCLRCGCLGNDPDNCNNRIYWKFNGVDYIGCSMESFYFNDIKSDDIPLLFSLLEHEYDIKKEG